MQVDQAGNGTKDTIQILRNFLMSRYNAEARFLDLQNLYSDQYLNANGLFDHDSTRSKMFPALMKIAGMDIEHIDTVRLDSCGITDISAVTTLAATFPHLKNLSLGHNSISQWRQLDPWRHKFRELRELILTGNPITGLSNYKTEIMRRFPSLKMLDGEVVQGLAMPELNKRGKERSSTSLAAANITKLPVATLPSFFETSEIHGIAMNFLGNFLQVYDNDRAQLSSLYDDMSLFSMSLNTGVPREIDQRVQNWSQYIALSRNLTRITTSAPRLSRLAIGRQQISELFSKIPATRHDLASPEKFSVEAWTSRGVRTVDDIGISLIVHGEFTESSSSMRRSFDRTMFLLPNAESSFLVVSDMLTVRGWASNKAWTLQ
ncbi:hypothetical protein V1512DRAFT_253652 [Lipomyces arxii]|uniref:uncharacterized protein n=1 Tax=Lipomyces arxii TaxID=56418 RepID=UPI0034CEBFD3